MRWSRYKTFLHFFCFLALCREEANAAPAVGSKQPPRSMCKASEIPLFDCDMRAASTVASVCQSNRQVIFRLSTWWGNPDLEVVSNGHDGRARRYVSHMGGNPSGIGVGAKQYTMRFIWHGVDFYSHVTDSGRKGVASGLAIEKDNVLLANNSCSATRHLDFQLPDFVDEETDEKHTGIY